MSADWQMDRLLDNYLMLPPLPTDTTNASAMTDFYKSLSKCLTLSIPLVNDFKLVNTRDNGIYVEITIFQWNAFAEGLHKRYGTSVRFSAPMSQADVAATYKPYVVDSNKQRAAKIRAMVNSMRDLLDNPNGSQLMDMKRSALVTMLEYAHSDQASSDFYSTFYKNKIAGLDLADRMAEQLDITT